MVKAEREPPPGYLKCIEQMQEAARVWMATHPGATLRFKPFEENMKAQMGQPAHARIAFGAGLYEVIDHWADNAETRSLLQAMEDASRDEHGRGQATYLQAKAIIEDIGRMIVDHYTVDVPAHGSWQCPGCAQQMHSLTHTEDFGDNKEPTAGSISVCSSCGTISQVNDAADGLQPFSAAQVRALPKSIRVRLLGMKNRIEARLKAKAEHAKSVN